LDAVSSRRKLKVDAEKSGVRQPLEIAPIYSADGPISPTRISHLGDQRSICMAIREAIVSRFAAKVRYIHDVSTGHQRL
jgi:hypothetical protein